MPAAGAFGFLELEEVMSVPDRILVMYEARS